MKTKKESKVYSVEVAHISNAVGILIAFQGWIFAWCISSQIKKQEVIFTFRTAKDLEIIHQNLRAAGVSADTLIEEY